MSLTPDTIPHRIVLVSSEWDQRIRNLYSEIQEELGTSPTFIKDKLNGDLKVPSETYKGKGKYLLLILTRNHDDDNIDKEQIIGFVTTKPREYENVGTDEERRVLEVQNLQIHKDYRRMGLGKKLLEKISLLGIINLSCFGKNKAAIAFYNSLDFLRLDHEEHCFSKRDNVPYVLYHYKSNSVLKIPYKSAHTVQSLLEL